MPGADAVDDTDDEDDEDDDDDDEDDRCRGGARRVLIDRPLRDTRQLEWEELVETEYNDSPDAGEERIRLA